MSISAKKTPSYKYLPHNYTSICKPQSFFPLPLLTSLALGATTVIIRKSIVLSYTLLHVDFIYYFSTYVLGLIS